MKISNVRLEEDKDKNSVLLVADCNIRYFGSDKIYFKFDKKYKEFISIDASAFAAALLIPAMKLGQDLIIEGKMSEQLYRGMQEIMKTMLSWNIGLKPISILADTLERDTYKPIHDASFFSGGVDSFYTYLKSKEEGDKKITYFILARGYDISLQDKELWDMTCHTVEEVAKEENVEVVKIESNIRDFIEPIMMWDYTHGGCLAALGLCLRKELKNVFIASTYTHNQMFPWGSHPDTDHFWSTETESFHHHGADTSRVDKVRFISNNPLVWKTLRVCYINPQNAFNCGSCDKCLRTMVNLLIAGVLEKSETFPSEVTAGLLRKIKIEGEHGAIFHKENLVELEKLGTRQDLQDTLRESLKNINISHQSYLDKILNKVLYFDYLYARSVLRDTYRLLFRKT